MPDKATMELALGKRLKAMNDITVEAKARKDSKLTVEEIKAWDESRTEILALKASIKALGDMDSLLAGSEVRGVEAAGEQKSGEIKPEADGRYAWGPGLPGKNLGQIVTGSAEYKRMLGTFPGNRASDNTKVHSEQIGLKSLRNPSMKDFVVTGSSATSAGSLVWPQFDGLTPYWSSYQRPLVVRQLFSQATTETDTIEYVRITSVTNNAAMAAEATSEDLPVLPATFAAGAALSNVSGGGYAAESGMVFERDTVLVQDMKHWIPVTKRALSDAGQIQSQIDVFLGYGLEANLETQLLAGNGSTPNLNGLANVSGVQTYNQSSGTSYSGAAADNDPFVALRRSITYIRINAHCQPTGILCHPADWEGIDLQRTGVYNGSGVSGLGQFIGSGPFGQTAPTMWGLPVVLSEAVTVGTAWVAAWNRATVFDRQQASIQITDSHADFFIRGLVAMLAEERVAFAVLHPQAFLEITNFSTVVPGSGTIY
jgi:HK97 family phage major capsid protein